MVVYNKGNKNEKNWERIHENIHQQNNHYHLLRTTYTHIYTHTLAHKTTTFIQMSTAGRPQSTHKRTDNTQLGCRRKYTAHAHARTCLQSFCWHLLAPVFTPTGCGDLINRSSRGSAAPVCPQTNFQCLIVHVSVASMEAQRKKSSLLGLQIVGLTDTHVFRLKCVCLVLVWILIRLSITPV